MEQAKPKSSKRLVKILIEVFLLASAVALGLVLRICVFEPAIVGSESMSPTLKVGDRVLVNKSCYRDRLPARQEVIVFNSPKESPEVLVKRIIGLPGDLIQHWKSEVYVNGRKLEEPYAQGQVPHYTSARRIPEDEFYVLGDNRDHSEDSRDWGSVPLERLRGRALLVYYPLDRISRIR